MFQRLSPLFPYLRRYWRSFLWGGLSLLIYNSAKVVIPQLIGNAIDDMRHGLHAVTVQHDALLLLGVAVLSGIFLYLMRQIIIGASREIEYDIRNDLFQHLETQPPSFFQRHRTGDIMARSTNDLNAVRQLLGPAIMYSANTVVFTAAALPFMIHISPRLTLIAFLPLPFASILVQYFGARIHTRFERIQAMFSDISAMAEENFSGARLIRAFAQEEAQVAAFETANQEYIRRSLLLARLMAMLWPTLEFVLGISLMITLLVGGREVVQHQISVGQFTSYFVYMVQLTWPMIAIGWVTNLVQRGAASVTRIDALMTEKPAIDDSAADPALLARANDAVILSEASQLHRNAKSKDPETASLTSAASSFSATEATPIRGHITLHNLSFAYPTGPEVLHNISLDIPAGSSLAITGPTGSGKSTLVSLIPRLQDAAPGMILLDDRPIRDYPLATLRRAIGFVPQETFLFSETIRENIAFGVSQADDQTDDPAVFEAACIAHIADEILEFPRGFSTLVGERGMTLSGGQKQRTAIARALLRDPRILILDDALASVDTYTEEQILSGLRDAMQGRTSILIAHRVSTARSADRIAVVVAGRIAELGTHDQLLARGGYYSELFEKQSLEEEIVNA
ncbi:MAG TPA: ABC transporter ATP-binding protein [Acidobacteriaceae bacterium]|jgi:ATP-binding cassette subfamily B protein|nr:ABC transporter ATP-binding protein [Acidobacteriaceae bacterium]